MKREIFPEFFIIFKTTQLQFNSLRIYSTNIIARVLYNYLTLRESVVESLWSSSWSWFDYCLNHFHFTWHYSSSHIGNANSSAEQNCWPSCTRCRGPQIKQLIFWNKAAVITNWQQCMCVLAGGRAVGKRGQRLCVCVCGNTLGQLCFCVARLGSELGFHVMASCGQSTRQYISQALPRFRFRTHTGRVQAVRVRVCMC